VEGLILWDDLTVEPLPVHGRMTSVNQLETYEEALVVGADSLYMYQSDTWYYPGDFIPYYVYSYYGYNTPIIPLLDGIHDIFYSLPTGIENEFSNLVISTHNEVHAIYGENLEIRPFTEATSTK